jgi:alginate O-acetyltransferase complex protein AlgJ
MDGRIETIAGAALGPARRAAARPSLLARRRRWFAALAFLLLLTPLVVGLVAPDSAALVEHEGRRLAPPPAAPGSLAEWEKLPAATDAFLKDHFGLRHAMIQLHRDLTKPMLGLGGPQLLIGRSGRMFYLGDDLVRESAGLVVRDERIEATVDMLVRMRDELQKRGIKFLVASPPNSATVYNDDLPVWAQNKGRRTEYDVYLDDLAAHGIEVVDLRPPLAAAKAAGKAYYLYDSHWTAAGAIAAFNTVVAADGHPGWTVDPATALGPETRRTTLDVARYAGLDQGLSEPTRELNLSSGTREAELSPRPMPDHVQASGKPGPTILIIGDSFTTDLFTTMLVQHVGKAIWINHRRCGFDWKWIDVYHPDEVWWAPTERFLNCTPGEWPVGLPR